MEDKLIYYLIGVPVLGILAQWIGWRFRLPSILLLLGFGIILGQGFGLNPDTILAEVVDANPDSEIGPKLLFPLVTISVAIILFEGGLSLQLSELREAGTPTLRLITVGVIVSWSMTTVLAWLLFDLTYFRIAALVGAVLVVTGPTVVAPLLRHIRPKRIVGSIVKWEGIVIDPIGAILAVLVFEYAIAAEGETATVAGIVKSLFMCTVVAGLIGWGSAVLLIQLLKRFWIPDFLHTVSFLAAVLGAFGLANWLHHESGLVTVTVFGIVMANQKQVSIQHIIEFKEGLGVLLISCLFIVLGSRVSLDEIGALGWPGLLFLACMILLVRPASVFLSMIRTELSFSERAFVAGLAPRGIVAAAVTAVFALKVEHLAGDSAQLAGMAADAAKLVPITFLVIIGTVACYGLTAAPFAKLLGVGEESRQGILFGGADEVVRPIAQKLHELQVQVVLVDTHYQNVSAARVSGLRGECVSILSERIYDDIDLSGVGHVLAMTPNDEVNAMAAGELKHLFGSANAFRLYSRTLSAGRRSSITGHHPGRRLFAEHATYTWLETKLMDGWVVKNTGLTEEFDFDEFQKLYGGDALVMFVVEAGTVTIVADDQPPNPKPGQTVVALVDPSHIDSTESDSA